ncbi:MAG: hypothetical protein R2862_09010 [Thermoanaerobaculia bacterium]
MKRPAKSWAVEEKKSDAGFQGTMATLGRCGQLNPGENQENESCWANDATPMATPRRTA